MITKVKNKIIDFFSDIFIPERDQDSESMHRQEWINMNQQYIIQEEHSQNKCFRINISFIRKQMLDIEFFDESHDDIEIKIYNQYAEEVYGLSILTVPSLHIMVDMKEWLPGFYQLIIHNNGYFQLNGSFILNEISLHDQSEKFLLEQNFRDEDAIDIYSA